MNVQLKGISLFRFQGNFQTDRFYKTFKINKSHFLFSIKVYREFLMMKKRGFPAISLKIGALL